MIDQLKLTYNPKFFHRIALAWINEKKLVNIQIELYAIMIEMLVASLRGMEDILICKFLSV